jgi:hypothetical protein
MRPRVVITYAKFGDVDIEADLLQAEGCEVIATGELISDSAWEFARKADA